MAGIAFPNETKQYRTARKKLLKDELALRREGRGSDWYPKLSY